MAAHNLLSAKTRKTYWIIGGRAPVWSYIFNCVVCAHYRGIRAQQLIGQLPMARLTPARAFLNTGSTSSQYAGPISLKLWKGRGYKSYKGWLVFLVYMAKSAVHIEIVSDYTSDGFISVYWWNVSRPGICKTLYSDCGTNVFGADQQSRKLFSSGSKEALDLAHFLLNDGTKWKFNPLSAPHFGRKWEAAVKSVKFHLKHTIGDTLLTFEELSTLLSQIEVILNSRQLEPLSEDPDDLTALTPGHFLIGEAQTTVPESSLDEGNLSRLSRWQLIQQKLQSFWKHW